VCRCARRGARCALARSGCAAFARTRRLSQPNDARARATTPFRFPSKIGVAECVRFGASQFGVAALNAAPLLAPSLLARKLDWPPPASLGADSGMMLETLGTRIGVIAMLGFALGACGGDEDTAAATDDGSGNQAPLISGTPPTAIDEGATYSFVPSAGDADGDPLSFGIEAKPGWAAFDATTGQLSGTPTDSDVGTQKGIVIYVSDGRRRALLPAFDLTVRRRGVSTNQAPTIGGTPPTAVVVGTAYSFAPTASDPDGDPLTFTIRNRPSWAAFDAATGSLKGTPTVVGTSADIVISVSDGRQAAALPAFTIAVGAPAVNRAPVISGTPPTSVEAGKAYAFVPTASDPDDNPLTFQVARAPSWASFDTSTGRLAGTPPSGTTGTFNNIVISVSDGVALASLPPFAIDVTAPTSNRAPTISGTPTTTARQGTAYTFRPTAGDADGDPLTFSIANRPVWATFNVNTGALQGTPGATHVRTYSNIVISVSDGRATAPLSAFSITVQSSNTPPTISGTAPTTATVGTQYTFTPTANDANGNTLTFSITNRPSWATFSSSTGRVQGTPTAANVGTFANVTISVSDGQDSAQLAPFSIVVSDVPNRAPTIAGTPLTAVVQGAQYAFTPTAADADNDTLTFNIANRPTWAAFDPATGRLSGTPSAQHVGTTNGIVISVSDGTATASLPAFALAVQAVALGSATLSWTPPTQNTDGSALTNLAGYKVYWGTQQGTYPNSVTLNSPGITSYVVESLGPGTYFFVATALSSTGAESSFSSPATKTIQ
jgi:hypothetical protein